MKLVSLLSALLFSLCTTVCFALERTTASEITTQIQNTYSDKSDSIADNSTNDNSSNKEFTVKLRKKSTKRSKRRPSSTSKPFKILKAPTTSSMPAATQASASKINALKYFNK